MKHKRRGYGAILISVLLLCACTPLNNLVNPDWSLTGQDRVTQAGVIQNIDPDLEKVDLIKLLNAGSRYVPGKKATETAATAPWPFGKPPFISAEAEKSLTELYAAYRNFEDSGRGPEGRNQIQDEILRASEQRCNVYKGYIRRTQSSSNFVFGSLATLLGGLGAIFTDATVARSLAGSAGIVSGINAEYQQAYFSNLATEVIVDGIETRRKRIRNEIAVMQQSHDLSTYTVQAAVLDAVRFHGACTIVEGLREASQSIKTVQNPGMNEIKNSLRDFAEARKMIDQIQKGEDLSSAAATVTTAGSALPGALGMDGSGALILGDYPGSLNSPAIAISRARAGALRVRGSMIEAIADKKAEFAEDSKVTKADGEKVAAALKALQEELEKAHQRLDCKFTGYKKCDDDRKLSKDLAERVIALQATVDLTERARIRREIVKLRYLAKSWLLIDLEETQKQFRDLLWAARSGLDLLKPGGTAPETGIKEIQKRIEAFLKGGPDGTDATKCTSSCP